MSGGLRPGDGGAGGGGDSVTPALSRHVGHERGGRVVMTQSRIALGAIRMWQSGRYAEDAVLARGFFPDR